MKGGEADTDDEVKGTTKEDYMNTELEDHDQDRA